MMIAAAPPPRMGALVLVDITVRIEIGGANEVIAFMESAPDGFASLEEAADAVSAYLPHRPRPTNTNGLKRNLRLRNGRYYWHWDPAFMRIGRDAQAKFESQGINPMESVARAIDIPFCVAGGIRSVDDARAVLHAGADKVSVNTPALERPELIGELAEAFGVQCVVVGVDSLRDEDGQWRVRQYTGDPARTRALPCRTLDWIVEAQERGAGEIVLNCMGSDGVRSGYDIAQLRAVRERCAVPLVASGGAGAAAHFAEVFREADVDAALAASVFHSRTVAIPELKRALRGEGIEVRDGT